MFKEGNLRKIQTYQSFRPVLLNVGPAAVAEKIWRGLFLMLSSI